MLQILKPKTSGVNDVNRKKTDKKMAAYTETLTVEDVHVTDQEVVKTLNIASGSVLRTLKCQRH